MKLKNYALLLEKYRNFKFNKHYYDFKIRCLKKIYTKNNDEMKMYSLIIITRAEFPYEKTCLPWACVKSEKKEKYEYIFVISCCRWLCANVCNKIIVFRYIIKH